MQRRLIPLKRDHDTPLLGSSTCFDGSSRGGSDGPLLPSASRINPHKPSRSPALHGRCGSAAGMAGVAGTEAGLAWKPAGTEAGHHGKQSGQGWKVGWQEPRAEALGGLQDSSPYRTTTKIGSATRSGGCHAIAQKGPAKAFCCAGGMMTADGGVVRLLW